VFPAHFFYWIDDHNNFNPEDDHVRRA
jgi:hypothetical protein